MTHESAREAFLEAILAEPDNELHRLIYADWLEDNGDSEEAEKFRTLPGLAGVWSSGWGEDQYGLWCDLTFNGATQRMRWIPSGTFRMGSPEDEEDHYSDESPMQEVEISRGFWYGSTTCTQSLWKAVMGYKPSSFRGARRPVENVSWADCLSFCDKCNEQIPGVSLTLPTEAQWEYTCRAGTNESRYLDDLHSIAWTQANSDGGTQPVGKKLPNNFGLHDTLGNVFEWCFDGMRYYKAEPVTDPVGEHQETSRRAIRGSNWSFPDRSARAAYRLFLHPRNDRSHGIGFRFLSST